MMNNDSVHNKTIEESILSDDYDGLFPNDDVEYQKMIIAMACSPDPAISSKGNELVYMFKCIGLTLDFENIAS